MIFKFKWTRHITITTTITQPQPGKTYCFLVNISQSFQIFTTGPVQVYGMIWTCLEYNDKLSFAIISFGLHRFYIYFVFIDEFKLNQSIAISVSLSVSLTLK